MSKKVDEHLKEAIENIREDRKITREYLSPVAAKHIETLQRSNEQIVKIATLMSKNEKSEGLSDDDMDDIYSMIKKEDD